MKSYEVKLLDAWEEIYKRGQLTLWIMLALKKSAKHMHEIKEFIEESTDATLVADDKSMYRALRRYCEAEMIEFTASPNASGPDRKVYSLTTTGEAVLEAFLNRNMGVFYKPEIMKLVKEN